MERHSFHIVSTKIVYEIKNIRRYSQAAIQKYFLKEVSAKSNQQILKSIYEEVHFFAKLKAGGLLMY